MKIEKAVIPAAGRGTRLRPLTDRIPKVLVPIGSKTIIEHAIETCMAGGIKDYLIIVSPDQGQQVKDHLGSGEKLGIRIDYEVQKEQKGLGHAVLHARDWVGDEHFVVVYGDTYIKPPAFMRELLDLHYRHDSAVTLALNKTADLSGSAVRLDEAGKVLEMIEKPTEEEVVRFRYNGQVNNISGLGALSPAIFGYIEKTPPGKKGEIQITDAFEAMRRGGHPVYGILINGTRFDVGTFENLERAREFERSIEPGYRKKLTY